MPFDRGTLSFSMFELTGDLPEDFAACFASAKAGTLDSVTHEPQIGWVTGRHLLDTDVNDATIVRGGMYSLILRQAVRKIPATLLNALCQREEQVFLAANPGRDYVSGKDKKRIKEDVTTRHIGKMPPALSGIPMVLDPQTGLLFLGATSVSQIDLFIEQFYRVTKLEPIQLTPALILDREFHTVPAQFPALELTGGPVDPAEANPGRDFLTWLLHYAEKTGKLTFDGHDFDVMIEAPLLLAGDSEAHGSQEATIKNGDSPLRSAEVKAALSVGKKLRKAKISLTRDDDSVWSGTFDADNFVFSSFKLPETEEMHPDEVFAERVRALEDFRETWTEYFKVFANSMLNDFDATQKGLRQWIRDREAI